MTLAELAQRRANNTGNVHYIIQDSSSRKCKVVANIEKFGPDKVINEFKPTYYKQRPYEKI